MSAVNTPPPPASSVAPARACAHRVLRRVFDGGAYADKALLAEARVLSERDRALAMRLSYGAIQRAGTTDSLTGRLAGRPVARLDEPVRASLRLGLYELLYLGGAPDYAVVADAVELAKSRGRQGHGLVNAVLRRAAREGAGSLLGNLDDRTPASAAVKHSHPEWIAELWWQALGPEDTRKLLERDNEPSELTLRANTLVSDADDLAAKLPVRSRRDPSIEEALILEEPFDVRASSLWSDGAFIAQSRAAMLVARALAPRPGESVLDLCAAPGGKTSHLAALMEDRGRLVAVELGARRARALQSTLRRMRATIAEVVVGDAREFEAKEDYDRVLVDPPCSGLGTLQARADLRWRVTPEAIETMRIAQSRILESGARVLRPGGVLVYSTCTISPTENEHLIADFLDRHPDFQLEELAAEMPDFAMGGTSGDARIDAVRGRAVQTLPHRHATAGFFVARMRRT